MKFECSICAELTAAPNTRFTKAFEDSDVRNAIFSFSEHFAMIPSLGALAEGHALLVTRAHATSVLGGLDEDLWEDVLRHLKAFKSRGLREPSGNLELFCFEHGETSGAGDQPLCSTTHAHLHVIPLESKIVNELYSLVSGIRLDEIASLSAQKLIRGVNRYIIVFRIDRKGRFSDCLVKEAIGIPSQYMRQIVAQVLELEEWDWRVEPASGALRRTLSTFQINKPLEIPRFSVGVD